MKINPIWNKYPLIKPELESTMALMENNIQTDNKPVSKAIVSMMDSGGKLLRPAYLLLFSMFQKADRQKMIALAAAVETLHMATLIHDDVVDQSPTRRGQSSIQAQFGQSTAVYSGDYLFVVCFNLLADHASDFKGIQQYGQWMGSILNGEMVQMAERYDTNISIDQYLKQISGKTGQLFSLSAFLGAYEGGGDAQFAQLAGKIGLNIGMSFQLMDDILDYTDSSSQLGKPVHSDVRQGVYSAPLILAMQQQRDYFLPLLAKKNRMSDADTEQVVSGVMAFGGIQAAKAYVRQYTQTALKQIDCLPDKPAKKILISLTKDLLDRQA
ncbi:polyprenyl synthetase family protein [Oenococcus kitaharae]|uniref:Heptaprenyl diphosphate synthase component II n=1 Tax=Oenococcus kitaharae DSM 17330 TaxID=1045004 RepID=G9WIL2_9LACO|nr:polyprenyl synthetase family protein [Oenococcus kitaharae]EHN58151.1 Heptaprenyl diphosphate synthase component II [Oenococcus kitaharae DSM 17330]OEY81644.1 heptaprenyl diphosphate synthase [Oenococcus kitaharae]OEY83129.1 heptaprenyl diphosphate synthase [Oenococcus kitaharae]OEY84325.1 heptaprenyl diphosphate synthase [Oenococcus kitaharae]